MAFELKVPDIGEGLTEVEVVEWLVEIADTIEANQPIVSVETAKAVVEISAPKSGVLLHQGAPAGAILEVGSLLAVIGGADESWASEAPPDLAGGIAEAEAATPSAQVAAPPPARGPVRAVPLVRRLAKSLGVDLSTVSGSGPQGQITRADVEGAAAAPPKAAAGAPSADTDVELSATRRSIARNMAKSWTEIPHVTVWGPADGSRLLAARAERGGPIEAYLIGVVLPILVEFPDFSASFDGTNLTRRGSAHIAVAMDTPAGLVVPVVKDAGSLSHADLVDSIERLVTAARDRTLAPDDMIGGTFTISNVGAVGGGYGTPIIPPGTTAIVSVGRAKDDVVVRDNAIAIAPVFPVSLSFDHRVIDGASASLFLNRMVEGIETFDV